VLKEASRHGGTWGSGGITPRILNLVTGLKRSASRPRRFTPPGEKSPQSPLVRRLIGPQEPVWVRW